ncbi:MAG: hypothetical protein LBQ64_03060, partial [Bacteroidales bacterium]|nr:hypothetical protein [Bacteroidales bacterium]
MENLANIHSWKQQFGLYPILMNPKISESKFLMLNGGNKDFCLQTDLFVNDKTSCFSDSWSTNTKNFVALDNDYARIYNWYDDKIESYPLNQVEENLDRFYDYLSLKSYKTPSDVVPFIIDVFRQLRNLTGKRDPDEALNLLFKLLMSTEDYTEADLYLWGIADVKVPSDFDYYVELIRQGVKSIHPNRDLILRHVSGALFQEA